MAGISTTALVQSAGEHSENQLKVCFVSDVIWARFPTKVRNALARAAF
jgi:hypothetical protein